MGLLCRPQGIGALGQIRGLPIAPINIGLSTKAKTKAIAHVI